MRTRSGKRTCLLSLILIAIACPPYFARIIKAGPDPVAEPSVPTAYVQVGEVVNFSGIGSKDNDVYGDPDPPLDTIDYEWT